MTRMFLSLILLAGLIFPVHAHDQGYDLEGDYLYKVTTVRADTGQFEDLLTSISALTASDYYDDAGMAQPFIMRHSQGDQWDLMVITPMESWTSFYTEAAFQQRSQAKAEYADLWTPVYNDIAFAEDVFAKGPDLTSLQKAYAGNGLYHIEMFEAAAGKTSALIKQRQMENEYLSSTGQIANMIFQRQAGSNVDVFTIGFHKNFKAFAADTPASPEEKEAAAKAAGFKDRADLSFYLRSLLTGHHDTFATKVE